MTDITTITELVEPFSRIEVAEPKYNHKSTRLLWIVIIIIIAIFGIWGYIVYSEKQKISDSNSLN